MNAASLLSSPVQGSGSLLAVAVSDDGRMLAVGGGDRIVHVWDARSRQYIQVQTRKAVEHEWTRVCLVSKLALLDIILHASPVGAVGGSFPP